MSPPRAAALAGRDLTATAVDDNATDVPRVVHDISPLRAAWQACIVADPSLAGHDAPLCEALRRLRRALQRGPRRLAPAERAALVAAAQASLAGPRDFTGCSYNERLDRCQARAAVDLAVCELLTTLAPSGAALAPDLAAILTGTRVAPCVAACCSAGWVAQTQRQARDAAVRTLAALGPPALARLPPAALLPCFAAGERRLARTAAALLARHIAAAPALVPVLLIACRDRMTDTDHCLHESLCQALARAATGLATRDLTDARRYASLRRRDERPGVRASAVRALAALGARAELTAALHDPASPVRYAALRALGRSTRELCRRDSRRAP